MIAPIALAIFSVAIVFGCILLGMTTGFQIEEPAPCGGCRKSHSSSDTSGLLTVTASEDTSNEDGKCECVDEKCIATKQCKNTVMFDVTIPGWGPDGTFLFEDRLIDGRAIKAPVLPNPQRPKTGPRFVLSCDGCGDVRIRTFDVVKDKKTVGVLTLTVTCGACGGSC